LRPCLLAPVLAIFLLAGCGEEQEPVADPFVVKEPRGARHEVFRRAGVELDRPANWKIRRRDAPGVFEIFSGEAVVTGWAYPRDEQLPQTAEQLESARKRLVDAIRERDPDFEVTEAATGDVGGSPAILVRGTQVISKRLLRTRSVHVFTGEAEYVFEALAPPETFPRADRVLAQVLRTVELGGEVAEERE
jgi:hypothetical protein